MARPAALAFALCIPFVFVHAEYQPSWTFGLGSSEATLYVSDVAVLAAAAIGLFAGVRSGFAPLREGRAVYAAGGFFLLVVFASTAFGALTADAYETADHALTALKLAEYAALALAAPLALRSRADLRPLVVVVTVWSVVATAFAILQYLGLADEFEGRRPGQREPSFLGIHDFGALSGAAYALALLAVARGGNARLAWVAGVAGGVGVVLSGATAAAAGVAAAAVAVWLLERRRAVLLGALVAAVIAGAVVIRTVDSRPLLDALGIDPASEATPSTVEPASSWSQRVALAYIGARIFADHPVFGVGWQHSGDLEAYGPHLDDARRRFPDLSPVALPSPEHPWGVQNAYVQAAADMGVVGLAAFLALFLVPLRTAWRVGANGAVPILWLLVAMGVWIGLGLVAGNPLVGLTWLAIGLAAAAAAWRDVPG